MTTIGRQSPFIATGHGYEQGSRGRCTAFDGFTVIAKPLGGFDEAGRASRIFQGERPGSGCDYSSHAIKLAVRDEDAGKTGKRDLFILMQNGSGREVMRLRTLYSDGGEMESALLAMSEKALYCILYSAWDTAKNAANFAQDTERQRWIQAHADKRIRQRTYRSRGRMAVWIEPRREPGESEESYSLRKSLAAPARA